MISNQNIMKLHFKTNFVVLTPYRFSRVLRVSEKKL